MSNSNDGLEPKLMCSISLQPKHVTPQVLKDYAKRFGVKPGWTFLTGTKQDTEIIRRKLGFYGSGPVVEADKSQHTGMLRIGNDPYDR